MISMGHTSKQNMSHVPHNGCFSLKPDFLWRQRLPESLELFQIEQKTRKRGGQPHPVSAAVKTSTPASRVSMLSARIELVVLFLDGSAMLAAWKPKYASASFRLTQ